MIDLRRLRPWNLTSPEYSHILLALYWAVFGIAFALVEVLRPLDACTPVWCPLDDLIPFTEWFFIPYMFWFVFLVGINFYLVLFEPAAFRRFMYFVMLTYSITLVVYIIYPTCQSLRPQSFPRDNFLTRFVTDFYSFDTNTNVCPSLHVIGSFAVAFGAGDSKRFRAWGWKLGFFAVAALISVSTVFVKQHSAIDIFWALVVCAVGYAAVYALPVQRRKNSHAAHG